MRISDWSSDVCSSDLLVDHTTVSAKIARRLAEEAASKGLLAVDAPVSGGQAGAESGQLAIMCGGSAEAFSAAEPAMQAYAKRIVHVGEAGSGQLAKRSEEHTSELQSLMRISYAVFCLKKKTTQKKD